MPYPQFVVFLGTNAELIKTMPVLRELSSRGIAPYFIASGQNYPLEPGLLEMSQLTRADLQLSNGRIPQNPQALLFWFLTTFFKGIYRFIQLAGRFRKPTILVVHGDTISTVMGAALGKLAGFKVAHIESGLRSGDYLKPFPEEIDRTLADKMADINFCPDEEAKRSLTNSRGLVVSTNFNTLIESIQIAIEQGDNIDLIDQVASIEKYFIFVFHRQEHIYNRQFLNDLFGKINAISKTMRCVFILYEPTKIALDKHGMLQSILENKDIVTLERQNFVDFVKLLMNAEFIITDGGSNQQEAYYLGIPCLILRNTTECREGLEENVVLFNGSTEEIDVFVASYKNYRRGRIRADIRPSKIVVDTLLDYGD